MISLCYGHKPRPFDMSSTKRYYPETIMNEAKSRKVLKQAISLKVGDEIHPLQSESDTALASWVVAVYHNQYVTSAPDDDGWEQETKEIEEQASFLGVVN